MPADIIVYALVAAGLVFWLRSILGTHHGDEPQRPNPFTSNPDNAVRSGSERQMGNVQAPASAVAASGAPGLMAIEESFDRGMGVDLVAQQGIAEIRDADKAFMPARFLRGAQDAFVMIVEAFAAGDQETLKGLLDEPVFNAFSRVIADRSRTGERVHVEIHAVRKLQITEARLDRRMAYITVRITSDETNVVRNHDDKIISGNPDRVSETIDVWTFCRDIKSRDPSWLLCETRDHDAVDSDHKTVPDFR